MTSIRGNIMKFVLRLTNNLNPIKNPKPIEKIRKYSALFMNDKTPKGYVLSKEVTKKGTKYDRVVKKDSKKSGRVIYYFHGGAYIAGLISVYRNFAVDFFNAAETELILLDYSCAPEYKYPTQLNEALDLWDELINNQGYKPENIIVGGDSAGGNLALAFLLKLRDNKQIMPNAAFCISPWADMIASGESYIKNYQNDVMFGEKKKDITLTEKEKFLNSDIYSFVGGADRKDPYISPVFADYHDFPPMFFTVGGHEMLLSDTLTIVKNLKKNKIQVAVEIQEEMFHTYPIYAVFLPEGAEALHKIVNFIKSEFEKNKA